MAKFEFVYWLLEYLLSQEQFVFEWDEGNSYKSEDKHGVTVDEIESCFYDLDLLALGEQISSKSIVAKRPMSVSNPIKQCR